MGVEQRNLMLGRKSDGLLIPVYVDDDGSLFLSGNGAGNSAPIPANSLELVSNLRVIDVAVPGTPEQIIGTSTLVYSFFVHAKDSNLGNVYIGFNDVDNTDEDTQLMSLAAGYGQGRTALPGAVLDMSQFYIDTDNAGEGAVIEYWTT